MVLSALQAGAHGGSSSLCAPESTQRLLFSVCSRDVNTELGRLIYDLFCTDPDDMYNQVLADKARHFKEDPKGVEAMGSVFDEVREEGIEVGTERARIQNAINMLEGGKLSIEEIAQYSGLPIEKVEELAGLKMAG